MVVCGGYSFSLVINGKWFDMCVQVCLCGICVEIGCSLCMYMWFMCSSGRCEGQVGRWMLLKVCKFSLVMGWCSCMFQLLKFFVMISGVLGGILFVMYWFRCWIWCFWLVWISLRCIIIMCMFLLFISNCMCSSLCCLNWWFDILECQFLIIGQCDNRVLLCLLWCVMVLVWQIVLQLLGVRQLVWFRLGQCVKCFFSLWW